MGFARHASSAWRPIPSTDTPTRLASAGCRHVTRALQWKGGVFHDRLATERDLADLAGVLAKLNES